MKKLARTGILILSFLTTPLLAQYEDWVNYTNGDKVWVIVEDGNYIWIGTEGGLVKINKTVFRFSN